MNLFFFRRNTGSIGDRVVDRADPSTEYGVVWYDPNGVCHWVAEFSGDRTGSGTGIPGFASREWAARFLHRYSKPTEKAMENAR
ncbi:hypothetical protein [Streptomyces sp. NPDC056921]|uniref:hypothetical protein n=1 Tax=Streptomyces sp. NPDC056921 TaxID=3345966 RepID=UPI00362BC76C